MKERIDRLGFAIVNDMYTSEEIINFINMIESADTTKPTFRKTNDLFAIRQFLKEIPEINKFIFKDKLCELIEKCFGTSFFIVKSIYFDKPEHSNWFVAYHQDLTISVDRKVSTEGFGPWTVKQNQFAVQPPLDILQDNFTFRIHLDDTDDNNGALKVIPESHLKGIYRPETIDWTTEKETICNVKRGGVMFMKPLLLHASGRTSNNHKRRVIHVECSKRVLPDGIKWSEYGMIKPYRNCLIK